MTDFIRSITDDGIGVLGVFAAINILRVVRRNELEAFASKEKMKDSETLSEDNASMAKGQRCLFWDIRSCDSSLARSPVD